MHDLCPQGTPLDPNPKPKLAHTYVRLELVPFLVVAIDGGQDVGPPLLPPPSHTSSHLELVPLLVVVIDGSQDVGPSVTGLHDVLDVALACLEELIQLLQLISEHRGREGGRRKVRG